MTFSTPLFPQELPFPDQIKIVACCDLDETYIPFSLKDRPKGGVEKLEEYLINDNGQKGIIIGWVTGSNLLSAFKKSTNYISRSPNFMSCSLGSEFYWVKNGKPTPSKSWEERIYASGFKEENITKVLDAIKKHGIQLVLQPNDYQGCYKKGFYYRDSPNRLQDFDWIENICKEFNIRLLTAKCNPNVGDAGDSYDVEFLPTCCGKDQTVLFLMERAGLPKESIYAFGDSENDLPMFAKAGHGFILSNGDPAAIARHGSSLDKPYCHGILSVLEKI